MNWSPAKLLPVCCPRSTTQSTSMSVTCSCDQFSIFRYHTLVYHACQTIIMRALFRVMASSHASEQFWTSKCSHCPVEPFRNGNFCRKLPFQNGSVGNGPVHTVLSKRSITVGMVQTLQCEQGISSSMEGYNST